MTAAQWQYRWRNGTRLKEIIRNWAALPKGEQSTATLELATDAAHLSRSFVAERCNESLQLRGLRGIRAKKSDAPIADDVEVDAGDE